MINLNLNQINLDAEINGIWVDYPNTKIKFKIARMNNKNYTKQLIKMRDEYPADEVLTEEQSTLILAEIYASSILIDWEGIELDGDVTEYNKTIGMEFFTDVRYRETHKFILDASSKSNDYYEKSKEITKKK